MFRSGASDRNYLTEVVCLFFFACCPPFDSSQVSKLQANLTIFQQFDSSNCQAFFELNQLSEFSLLCLPFDSSNCENYLLITSNSVNNQQIDSSNSAKYGQITNNSANVQKNSQIHSKYNQPFLISNCFLFDIGK